MKDLVRGEAVGIDSDEDFDLSKTTSSASAANVVPESTHSRDLSQIQDVVSRYVGQLLHGCKDPTCTEQLCDTGRRNTGQHPVRKYTPRSARAIAIALASGPNLKSRLCLRYAHARKPSSHKISEGPRDPAAFIQQLSDTASIRHLDPMSEVTGGEESIRKSIHGPPYTHKFNTRIRFWHDVLDKMSKSFASNRDATLEEILTANDEIASRLSSCILWLLSCLPRGNLAQWRRVNKIIGAGCEYPQQNQDVPCDPSYNTWLDILDGLQDGPSFQLLCHLLSVVAERRIMERRTFQSPNHEDQADVDILREKSRFVTTKLTANVLYGQTHLIERIAFIVWLKKAFLRHWDGEILIAEGTLASISLKLLHRILSQVRKSAMDVDLARDMFVIPVVAYRLDAVDLAQAWMDGPRHGHVLDFGFLFNIHQEVTYFRTMNHLRMRKANSDAETTSAMRSRAGPQDFVLVLDGLLKYLEERYLLLNVSRGNVLQDAFDQLWQRRRSELVRPLRVRLGEMDGFEVGHDLGGVQIEFFNLVCKELFRESAQMFTTDPTTGFSYFCPGSMQPLYMFELCGLLFAIAIYNGISLPVNFPPAFYLILMGHKNRVGLQEIANGWPIVKRSLDNMLDGDIPGIDFTFPLEANGLRLTVLPNSEACYDESSRIILPVVNATLIRHHESQTHTGIASDDRVQAHSTNNNLTIDINSIADAWPGWHLVEALSEPEEVTNENKSVYVKSYALWLALGCVEPQWQAFCKGFESVLDDLSMISFHYQHLQLIVEGSTQFDMNELRRATTYDGYEPTSKYIQSFWRLVTNWPEKKQKQLLKFVTACERIPPGGESSLTFRIQRATPTTLDHLPTSSTCFGTLMLPKYPSIDILDRKLSMALKFGVEGFGSG